MHAINRITFKLINEATQFKEPESEIIFDGQSTGIVISGKILEQAFCWQNKFLLFITDDIPYEEYLTIVLLDKHFTILDKAAIGCIYNTGTFENCKIESQDTVSFQFIGETTWRVKLLSEPIFRIPYFSEPAGVSREFGFKRQFVISGNPQREPRKSKKK